MMVTISPVGMFIGSTRSLSMRRNIGCWVALLLFTGAAGAAEPKGQIIEETWEAAYVNGSKTGFVHTVTRALNQDGNKVLRTTQELDLTVARFGDTAHVYMETGTDETPEGKVTGVSMRQLLAKSQQLALTGAVESVWQGKPGGGWKLVGKHLHVKTQGGAPMDKTVWWNDKV